MTPPVHPPTPICAAHIHSDASYHCLHMYPQDGPASHEMEGPVLLYGCTTLTEMAKEVNEPCSTPMILPDKPPRVVHTCTMDMTHSLDMVYSAGNSRANL